ncbi:ATP-binding cassette domain-containing protein [Bradyrhizobium sp. 13971]
MTWRQGGAYALLGPSGCGKTTLLNLISGIVTPSRGKILFDGRDITPLSTQKRNIAQVFQFPVIYDTMTVGQNLAFPLKNSRRRQGRGRRAGQADRRPARPHALSQAQGDAAHRRRQAEDLARPRPGALRRRGRPVRRAADGDRSRAEVAAALQAEGAASRARPHDDLRHPRPDRGADLRRHRRRDA